MTFLKAKSASEFRFVTAKIKAYQEDSKSFMDVHGRIFHIGPDALRTNSPTWLSSIMVHDAQHIFQYELGGAYTGQKQAELDANARQALFLRAVGENYHAGYIEKLNGAHYLTT